MRVPVDIATLPETDTVPAGSYTAVVESITGPHTDKNGNDYIVVTYAIKNGEFMNRKIFENYVRMDDGSLFRRIVEACLPPSKAALFQDTDELIACTVDMEVILKEDKEYGLQNRIKAYVKKTAEDEVSVTEEA